MAPQIAMNRQQIADFCRKWQVSEFDLFGSVLRDDFGPESDIDVAVRFSPTATYSLFDLVDMEEELKGLFGREVDLLTLRAIEKMPNPFRRRAMLSSLELVHAA